MSNRMEMLSALVRQNPNNLLARYGLAMECAQQGDRALALENFRAIIAANPDYVAAYHQAGLVLIQAGEIEQAREILHQGLAACDRAGNSHARSEIEAVLTQLAG